MTAEPEITVHAHAPVPLPVIRIHVGRIAASSTPVEAAKHEIRALDNGIRRQLDSAVGQDLAPFARRVPADPDSVQESINGLGQPPPSRTGNVNCSVGNLNHTCLVGIALLFRRGPERLRDLAANDNGERCIVR